MGIRWIAAGTAALSLAVAAAVPGAFADPPPTAHAAAVTVPNVRCMRLDRAERLLRRHHLRVRERGGGIFGIIIKRDWHVAGQSPHAGVHVARGARVTVYASRQC